jgi:hypothetical protein
MAVADIMAAKVRRVPRRVKGWMAHPRGNRVNLDFEPQQ